MKKFILIAVVLASADLSAQQKKLPVLQIPQQGLVAYTSKDSSSYLRFIGLIQFWARYTDANPGTVYKNDAVNHYSDLSIRRVALITLYQLHPRLLFVAGLASNSNSSTIAQQTNLNPGFSDAYTEYLFNEHLAIGAGLHQWTGFSRMNLESVGTFVNLDIPKFQFPYINQLDRNNRLLGVYAKGQWGRFDYRISLNDPYTPVLNTAPANTGFGSPAGGLVNAPSGNAQVNVAYYNPTARSRLLMGYFKWQFMSREYNKIPYETGNYLGRKKVLNIGAGFAYRKDGMLLPTLIEPLDASRPAGPANPNTLKQAGLQDVFCFAVDGFLAYPFSDKQDGINIYTGYFHTDMGRNFYTVGSTNQTVAAGPGVSPINGPGGAIPGAGTGNTFYFLTGYIAPRGFISEHGRVGVFGTFQRSAFEALKDPVVIYEAGLNWLIAGNGLKLTAQYRNRPIYTGLAASGNSEGSATVRERKGDIILQMQLSF